MKGAIYYAAIATVIFSHVKITCYFQVFARKLTWYFIGVYIIKSHKVTLCCNITRSFSNDDGDDSNENGKVNKATSEKLCTSVTISYSMNTRDFLISRFMEDEITTQRFFPGIRVQSLRIRHQKISPTFEKRTKQG